MEWYYVLGIISYGIFFLQGLLSCIGCEWDFDFDFDGVTDFVGFDIFSFKGIVHFLMGFSGWLMWVDHYSITTINASIYIEAIFAGIILAIILYFLYKFILNLNHEPSYYDPMIGAKGVVLLKDTRPTVNIYWVKVTTYFGSSEIKCYSTEDYQIMDNVTIKKFISNKYFI